MTFSLYNRFRQLEKVRVDKDALEGYLGASSTDGVLRTGSNLSYTDGGDYITLDTVQGIGTGDSPTFANLTLTQNSDTITIAHDGSNANFKWSDGDLALMTDEGTNTDTHVSILGKGTGVGLLEVYDTDEDSYITLGWKGDDQPSITCDTTPTEFNLLHDRAVDIKCWSSIISGNPHFYTYGFKAGDARKYLRQRVEADGDALIEAENNLNILAGGGAISFGNENLSTTGTLGSGELTVDSGAGCSIIIKGTSTGNTNIGWIGFYDSDGTTRRGYIGDGSSANDDIYLGTDTGDLRLVASGTVILPTGSTIGNLTLANGSITDSGGTISFGSDVYIPAKLLVLDKASDKGIKVDTTTPTYGWRDLLGDVFSRNTGATKPTFTTYRDTLLDYQFAAEDEEYFKFHIPHDYVSGTDIHLHIHWSHTGEYVSGGTVTFEYEVSYSKSHNQAPFSASVGTTFNGTASTTRWQQIFTEVQISASTPDGNQIDSDDLEPDGIIIARLALNLNDMTVSQGGVPDPFIHYVDIHYQSTNIATKDKIPDFYT